MKKPEQPEIRIINREKAPVTGAFGSDPAGEQGPDPPVCGKSGFLNRILTARGLNQITDSEFFLPEDYSPPDPFLLQDLDKATAILVETFRKNLNTGIFVHDDTDGFCSAAILKRVFLEAASLLGSASEVSVYVPDCLNEGHGLSRNALDFFTSRNVSVIVTADIGITDQEMIEHARSLGFRVIVTDHHKISRGVPSADVVVDPLRGGYPHRHLCGAGVVWKLGSALLSGIPGSKSMDSRLLPFAALGTLADLSPLIGENRHIVSRGVEYANEGAAPSIRELMRNLGPEGKFDESDISNHLAPLLNAGRSGQGRNPSFRLLDSGFDKKTFKKLRKLHDEKNRLIDTAYSLAVSRIDLAAAAGCGFIAVIDRDIPPSAPGAVAGRIAKNYGMPAFVAGSRGDVAVGEVRTHTKLDWVDALSAAGDLLDSFGGHPRAAGFSTAWDGLPRIIERIENYCRRFSPASEPVRTIEIDFEYDLGGMTADHLAELDKLRPFGSFNPLPSWLHDGHLDIEYTSGAGTLKVADTGLELEFADDSARAAYERIAPAGDRLCFIYTPASRGSACDITIREFL